ncbi:MAG: PAS domain S-box protein [Nanoarchaeota archaeon]|nr:PAS domain S-box protein [Nanoarchaeota archaeon]MBU1705047.1 PAS domain S-box protein [Nanoarchaeota archaeon]
MKIQTKMVMVFVLLMIMITSFLGVINFNNVQREFLTETINHLQTTAQSRVDHIEDYLNQNIERLRLITSRTQLREVLKEYDLHLGLEDAASMQDIIKDSKDAIQEIESISLIGLDGKTITSTDQAMLGKDIADEDYFIQGKDQNIIQLIGKENILVSGPFILDGKTIGVCVMIVDPVTLKDIVSDDTGLGQTGEVLIATKDNDEIIFIFDRKFEQEASSKGSDLIAEPMRRALSNDRQVFENSLDYRGKQVIAISRYLELGKLGLVAKIDRSEVFAPTEKLKILLLFISIIALAITSLGILIISRSIAMPINELTDEVDRITKGEIDLHLKPSTIHEIDSLKDSLSRILSSLKLALLKTGVSKEELGLTTEEALKEKKEAESKAQQYLDIAAVIILALDKEGNIKLLNKSGYSLLGYKPGELLGKNWFDTCIPKKEAENTKNLHKLAFDGKSDMAKDHENHILTKDGKQIVIRWHNSVIKDDKGEIIGTLSSGEDITEKKKIEITDKKKNEQLERFARIAVGREETMIALKKKIAELEKHKKR